MCPSQPLSGGGRFGRRLCLRSGVRFGSWLGLSLAGRSVRGLTIAILRRTRLALRRRWRTAGTEFLNEENLSEPETAAGEFTGIVVREKLDAFLAHFGEVNVPGELAQVIHRHAGAVFRLAAGLFLLTAAGFLVATLLFFHAALLFLLATEVFLFTPLLILLPALLGSLILALLVAGLVRALGLLVLGRRRVGGGAGRFVCGVRRSFRRGRSLCSRLVLLRHLGLRDVLHDLRAEVAGFFGIGVHIGGV